MSDTWKIMRARANESVAKTKIEAGEPVTCYLCMRVANQYTLCSFYCQRCFKGFCGSHGSFNRGAGQCMYCMLTKGEALEIVAKFTSLTTANVGAALDAARKAHFASKGGEAETPLTPEQIQEVLGFLHHGLTNEEIQERMGITRQQVAAVKCHQTQGRYDSY